MLTNISENLKRIKDRIAQSALKAGRSPEEITLVTVSKKQDLARIRMAKEAGVRIFGENYVQEAKEKIMALACPLEWHLIGHLQKNKVKLAVTLFDLIHTVDSFELAHLLNQEAQKKGKIQRVMVEVKLSEEETKAGASPEEAMELVRQVVSLRYLSLEGLMTMPPFFPDIDHVRPYFSGLRELREVLRKEFFLAPHILKDLSMGMSHDFEAAIEEGATMVRIGSAIFGSRE